MIKKILCLTLLLIASGILYAQTDQRTVQTQDGPFTIKWQSLTAWLPLYIGHTVTQPGWIGTYAGIDFFWEKSINDRDGIILGKPRVAIKSRDPGIIIHRVWVKVTGIGGDHKPKSASFFGGDIQPYEFKITPGYDEHYFLAIKKVVAAYFIYYIGKVQYYVQYDTEKGISKILIDGKDQDEWLKEKQEANQQVKQQLDDRKKKLMVEYMALDDRANTLIGVDKTEYNKLRNQFRQYSGGLATALNKQYYSFSESDQQSAEDNLTNMEAVNSQLRSEVDQMQTEVQNKKAEKDRTNAKEKSKADTTKNNPSATTASGYVESDHDRQMSDRADAQRKRDDESNSSLGALAGATGTFMAELFNHNIDNKDDDDNLSLYLKGTLGLGFQMLPVTTNRLTNSSVKESRPMTTDNYMVNGSLLFSIFNDKFINIKINPHGTFGLNALSPGSTGNHTSYGGGASLGLGRKLKILLKADYTCRSGVMSEDDAVLGVDVTATTDYNYNTLKYGTGLFFDLGSHDSFVELDGYRENISFLKNANAKVYSYEAKLSFSLIGFNVEYGPNYPIAGEVIYPGNYTKLKQDYISFSIFVPVTIFKAL
ncbi:hypothetical protein FO440_00125 [Mucilaginibacter corticis]|uniref:Outer membrane beta-barrel protein n=1 Tax=Mucilaginibacter corticis TaxID=2597670 RepID=A0A556MRU5_9SPHI|nr:hypothetical protein [Mucilaginibacter corticis]TSJ42633.1 hypothetical protein FO440_00125 [Mucilaginibacter corticis]